MSFPNQVLSSHEPGSCRRRPMLHWALQPRLTRKCVRITGSASERQPLQSGGFLHGGDGEVVMPRDGHATLRKI